MKQQAAAKHNQKYTKKTFVRCEWCSHISDGKCSIGGFPVALWGVCAIWKPKRGVDSDRSS